MGAVEIVTGDLVRAARRGDENRVSAVGAVDVARADPWRFGIPSDLGRAVEERLVLPDVPVDGEDLLIARTSRVKQMDAHGAAGLRGEQRRLRVGAADQG